MPEPIMPAPKSEAESESDIESEHENLQRANEHRYKEAQHHAQREILRNGSSSQCTL